MKQLTCDICGSTEKPLSRNLMTNELNPGQVSCGRCIFDRGNAAALRLAGIIVNVANDPDSEPNAGMEARRMAGADGWSV